MAPSASARLRGLKTGNALAFGPNAVLILVDRNRFHRMFSSSQRFPPTLTPVVAVLLVTNILVYFLMGRDSAAFVRYGALWPILPADHALAEEYGRLFLFKPWQLLTYGKRSRR